MRDKTTPTQPASNYHNNSCLHRAAKEKNDEYYTQPEDVERIVKAFQHHLKGKRIYCNCDTEESAFVQYFRAHKDEIGYTSLDYSYISYDDPENINKLDACDVVITNPPFSKYVDYIATILEHNKDFILIAPDTSLANRHFFFPFMASRLFYTGMVIKQFDTPNASKSRVYCCVITSFKDMDLYRDREIMPRRVKESPYHGRRYDNIDAIECSQIAAFPEMPVGEVIGVPVTMLRSPYRKEVEVIGSTDTVRLTSKRNAAVDGHELFKRVFVRKKQPA